MSTDAALALPRSLRAELAAKLQSLEDGPPGLCVDDEDFKDVLSRRSQELRDGTVKALSAEESIAAIRQALAERRRR